MAKAIRPRPASSPAPQGAPPRREVSTKPKSPKRAIDTNGRAKKGPRTAAQSRTLGLDMPHSAFEHLLPDPQHAVFKNVATQLRVAIKLVSTDTRGLAPRQLKSLDETSATIMREVYKVVGKKRIGDAEIEAALPKALANLFNTRPRRASPEWLPLFEAMTTAALEQFEAQYADRVLDQQEGLSSFWTSVGIGEKVAGRLRTFAPEVFKKPNKAQLTRLYARANAGEISDQEFYAIVHLDARELQILQKSDPKRFPRLAARGVLPRSKGHATRREVASSDKKPSKFPTSAEIRYDKPTIAGLVAAVEEILDKDPFQNRDDIVEALNTEALMLRFGRTTRERYIKLKSKYDAPLPNLRDSKRWTKRIKQEVEGLLATGDIESRGDLVAALQQRYPRFGPGHLKTLLMAHPNIPVPQIHGPRRSSKQADILGNRVEAFAQSNPGLNHGEIAKALQKEGVDVKKSYVTKLLQKSVEGSEKAQPAPVPRTFRPGLESLALIVRMAPPGTTVPKILGAFNRHLEAVGLPQRSSTTTSKIAKLLDQLGYPSVFEQQTSVAADIVAEYAARQPKSVSEDAILRQVLEDYPSMSKAELGRFRGEWRAHPERYPSLSKHVTDGKLSITGCRRGKTMPPERYFGGWSFERAVLGGSDAELQKLAEQSQFSRIPISAELLDYVFEMTGLEKPMQGRYLLWTTHMLSHDVPMARALSRAGAAQDKTIVVGSPYGASSPVRSTLEDLGLTTRVGKKSTADYRKTVERALDDLIKRRGDSDETIMVIDDGGLTADILHRNPKKYAKVIDSIRIVERTTGGLILAEAHELKTPIIATARADSKKYEGKFIAQAAIAKTTQALNRLDIKLKGKKVVVIGAGYVGLPLAKALKKLGAKTKAVDINPTQAEKASQFVGMGTETDLFKADIVIGATGTETLPLRIVRKLKDGVVALSVSSKDIELAMKDIKAAATKKAEIPSPLAPVSLPVTKYVINGKEVIIPGDGWPVTFDGYVECVPPGPIQISDGSVLLGLFQGAQTFSTSDTSQTKAGVIDLRADWDKKLLAKFKELEKSMNTEVADPTAWRDDLRRLNAYFEKS